MVRQLKDESVHRAKAERKAKRRAEEKEAARLAEKRRSKEVNVNHLTSISGAGGGKSGVICHGCGQKGHTRKDCPSRDAKRKSVYGGDRSKKKSKQVEMLDY